MTGARISFGVLDETAAQTAVFSSAQGQPWVDYDSLTNGIYPDEDPSNPTVRRYVTGEPGAVRLDSTYYLFPDDPGTDLGYWSAFLSDDSGSFPVPPVLSCGFDGTSHSSVGITIHFGLGTVLTDFLVEWLDGSGQVMSSKAVQGNTKSTVLVSNHVNQYQGLRITCQKTDQPYRYVKIQEVDFGERVVYDRTTLVSASLVEEVDISGSSVPAGSLQFTVLDPDGRLNPVNPDGIYDYLRQGIPITVEFLVDNEIHPGGIYYLDTWDGSNTATAKLTAVDEIGLKSSTQYASPFFQDTAPASASDIFQDIFTACQTNGLVSANVGSGSYTGYIPECKYQEALAHACLACGGFVSSNRSGGLIILPPPDMDTPTPIDQSAVLGEPTATQTKTIRQVAVEEYSYAVSSDNDFSEDILIDIGPDKQYYRYTFDGVYSGLQSYITEGIGNGSWHEEGHDYGYNYVGFTAWADDLNPPLYVHVTGRTVSASSFKRQVSADSAGTDVLQAAGIPLITKDNANEVAARLQQYGHMHTKIKAKIQMAPTMSCGDCVSIPTRFGSVVGCITRMDIDLTGGLLATVEVLA